jgi:hypothetical protein
MRLESAISKLEAERAEVEDVLSSGVLGRTNNLVRLITYVCEKYFEGAIDDIKEYNIAVHALGRREAFDPQVDTIVRVTAHAVRKRLEDYYRSAGAEHAVHICLPAGHYIPKFIHLNGLETTRDPSNLYESQNHQSLDTLSSPEKDRILDLQDNPAPVLKESKRDRIPEMPDSGESRKKFVTRRGTLAATGILAVSVFVLSVFLWKEWNRGGGHKSSPQFQAAAALGNSSGKILRVAMGNVSSRYIDRDGSVWDSDHYC